MIVVLTVSLQRDYCRIIKPRKRQLGNVFEIHEYLGAFVLERQRGQVVRAPDLKSGGPGFKSRSDR